MRYSCKFVSTLAVICLAFTFLPTSGAYPAPSGKVVVGVPGDVTTYTDPHPHPGGLFTGPTINMFEGLVGFNWKGEIVNRLCTSYEISDDGLTYTFHLRKGVKFHNGDPVTAEDIKYSVKRQRDPTTKAKWGKYLAKIKDMEIVDPDTIRFRLSGIDAFLINKLAWVCTGGVVPKKVLEKRGLAWFNRNPVGTGPYKFVSMVTGEKLVMEANEDYWGEVPAVKTIEWRIIPENASRVAAFKAGELDIIQTVPPLEAKAISADRRFKIDAAPNGEILFLVLNQVGKNANPVFKDIRVRKAFNYAINKKEIVDKLYLGYAKTCNTLAAPSLTWFDPTLPVRYDPEKAKALLKEANFDFSQSFDFAVPEARYTMGKESALAIADNLAAVGVKVNVKIMEYSQWIAQLAKDKLFALSFINQGNLTWSPDSLFLAQVHSTGSYSYVSYPEIDKLIDGLLVITDPAKQIEQTKAVCKKIHEEAVHVFLWEFVDCWGMKKNIDWHVGPGERFPHFDILKIIKE